MRNNNMKAIKTIMKLDKEKKPSGKEGQISLYEPYNKILTDLQAMKQHKRGGRKRNDRSMYVKRKEPLAKLILNDFENNFQKEELFTQDIKNLMIKNKVIDVMDDYYSRHISKGFHKPEHLFMFKAKPIIPPGRVLLEIERMNDKLKDKDKIHKPKMVVGESEISLFSPVRGDRKHFNQDGEPNSNENDQKSGELNFSGVMKHSSYVFPGEIKTSYENKDIQEIYTSQNSGIKKSIDSIKGLTNVSHRVNLSSSNKNILIKSGEGSIASSTAGNNFTFKRETPKTSNKTDTKSLSKISPRRLNKQALTINLKHNQNQSPKSVKKWEEIKKAKELEKIK